METIQTDSSKNNQEMIKHSIIYGLFMTLAFIIYDLMSYIFDLSQGGFLVGILLFFVWVGIFIYFFIAGGKAYRNKYLNGYINYSKAFIICLIIGLSYVIAMSLYHVLFYFVFDTSRALNDSQKVIEMISENPNIPDENKEEIIQNIIENAKAGKIIIRNLINNVIFSVILGAISALFIRKKEKIAEVY